MLCPQLRHLMAARGKAERDSSQEPRLCTESSSRRTSLRWAAGGWGGQSSWAQHSSGCQGSLQLQGLRLLPGGPVTHTVTCNALYIHQEEKLWFFFFFSVVRAIWCISEICFRLRWIMSLIINYIAHFKASPLPRYQVRCGKSLPSGPTILLFRNSLHIHWFPFSDTRLLPRFCLSWDFIYKSLYVMALELIFKQFWYIYFLIYKHHRGLCIPRKLLQGIAYKE